MHYLKLQRTLSRVVYVRTHSVAVGRYSYNSLNRADRAQLVMAEYGVWCLPDKKHNLNDGTDLFKVCSAQARTELTSYHLGAAEVVRNGRPNSAKQANKPLTPPTLTQPPALSREACSALENISHSTYKQRLEAAIAESQSAARSQRAKRRRKC